MSYLDTLVMLVFVLDATVGARLMFGRGFKPKLTWLRDFFSFGTSAGKFYAPVAPAIRSASFVGLKNGRSMT